MFIKITDTEGLELLINVNNIVVIEKKPEYFAISVNYRVNTNSYNEATFYTEDNIFNIIERNNLNIT